MIKHSESRIKTDPKVINEKIIKDFYEKNYHKLYNYFSRRISFKEAEDLVQLTFLKVLTYLKPSNWVKVLNIKQIKNLYSFVFKVAHNIVVDNFRKDNKKEVLISEVFDKTGEEIEKKIMQKIELEEIFKTLSDQEKLIIKLKIVDNLTFKEISKELNLNLNTVLSKFNRVLKKLKKVL